MFRRRHNTETVPARPMAAIARVNLQGLASHPPVRLENLRNCHALTIYTVGNVVDGKTVADVIRQCDNLQRLVVERRDNDWDAQETDFQLHNQADLATALQNHGLLRDFSLAGVVGTSLDDIAMALCTISDLQGVTLKATMCQHAHSSSSASLLSPQSLQNLLAHVPQRLSLAGLFPEHDIYQSILFRAFVTDKATVQIYLHFGGTASPSAFCYFLRHAMLVNQQWKSKQRNSDHGSGVGAAGGGTNSNSDVGDEDDNQGRIEALLQLVAQKRHFSRDAAYWMIRHHPWLCNRRGMVLTSESEPKVRRWKLPWKSK